MKPLRFLVIAVVLLGPVAVIGKCGHVVAAEVYSSQGMITSGLIDQVIFAAAGKRISDTSRNKPQKDESQAVVSSRNESSSKDLLKNSTNLLATGMVGPDLSASVIGVEYERLLTDGMSLMGRFAKLNYKYDDGDYIEDGDGSIFDIGVRFYPGRRGMRGFFMGVNLGLESTDWTYIEDKGQSYESAGQGTTDSLKVEFEIGGRFPLGSDHISLVPAVRLGSTFGQDNECRQTRPTSSACSEESELGVYLLLGLSLGIAF